MDMFDEQAPWQRAASRVKVFMVDPDFIIYGVPDLAVIQSWEPQPDHTMPDNQDGTLTNLVVRYSTWQRQR